MNIVFALAVATIYSIAFAVTRRPWAPWAICAAVCACTAAALILFTDMTTAGRATAPG